MATYGTRTRVIPKLVLNLLEARCRLEMFDPLTNRWIVTEDSRRTRANYSIYRTMTDVCTEDFYGKIAHGQFINNPMSRDKQVVDVWPASVTCGKTLGTARFRAEVTDDGASPVGYLPEPANLQTQIDIAKTRVGTATAAKAKSHQVQFLATIGEGKETVTMLFNAIRFLMNFRKQLRAYGLALLRAARCPKRFFKKVYKDAENAWMYCRMGIRPFVGECENIHAAITHMKEQRWRTRFGSKTAFRTSASAHTSRVNANRLYTGHFKSYFEETEVSAGCVCDVRLDGFPDTFGLTQFYETAWELTPCSWFIDYFLNVGKLIAAMRPDSYWQIRASWTTVKRISEEIIRCENTSYLDYGPPAMETSGMRRLYRERVTRTPGLSIGLVTLPPLTWDGKRDEILDSLALARQKMTQTFNWVFSCKAQADKRKK